MVTATVEFVGGKTITRAFDNRDAAVDWLMALKGSFVGWTSDGTFGICK